MKKKFGRKEAKKVWDKLFDEFPCPSCGENLKDQIKKDFSRSKCLIPHFGKCPHCGAKLTYKFDEVDEMRGVKIYGPEDDPVF